MVSPELLELFGCIRIAIKAVEILLKFKKGAIDYRVRRDTEPSGELVY